MTRSSDHWRDLDRLLDLVLDGLHTEEDLIQLNNILRTDMEACRHYVRYVELHGRLLWRAGSREEGGGEKGEAIVNGGRLNAQHAIPDLSVRAAIELPPQLGVWHFESALPPSAPASGVLGGLWHGTVGYLSSGWPAAYLITTVIFGIGALIGSYTYVSRPVQVAQQSAPLPSPLSSLPSTVGRITGIVDCKWADSLQVPASSSVAIGQTFALASGLLEISYDTGATVILQGPMQFAIESKNSGMLSIGKLTGKVKTERAKGFTIGTPTATVTDLGTEFGVEVSRDQLTQVHVFQGSVEAKSLNGHDAAQKHVLVTAGHAIQIAAGHGKLEPATFTPSSFVQNLTTVRNLATPTHTLKEKAYIDVVLADKPLGYRPLNESARTADFHDRSGHGFHGNAMNKVACERGGPIDPDAHAATLDGGGYFDMGRHDEFSLANNFTVEGWICIDGEMDPAGWIVSAADGERMLGWGLGACCSAANDDHPAHAAIRLTTWTIKDYQFTIPMELVGKDRWMHVAMVYDADNTVHFYLNGEHRESTAGSQPGLSGPVWVTIGCETPMSRGWQGRLAHVAVYPRTLSKEQIQKHYNLRNKSNTVTDK